MKSSILVISLIACWSLLISDTYAQVSPERDALETAAQREQRKADESINRRTDSLTNLNIRARYYKKAHKPTLRFEKDDTVGDFRQ